MSTDGVTWLWAIRLVPVAPAAAGDAVGPVPPVEPATPGPRLVVRPWLPAPVAGVVEFKPLVPPPVRRMPGPFVPSTRAGAPASEAPRRISGSNSSPEDSASAGAVAEFERTSGPGVPEGRAEMDITSEVDAAAEGSPSTPSSTP